MDVRSSRKEFLILGTFKINSIDRREGFISLKSSLDTKPPYYKSLHHDFAGVFSDYQSGGLYLLQTLL